MHGLCAILVCKGTRKGEEADELSDSNQRISRSLLAGLQIVHEPSGTTMLSGPLPDQASLFGVLLKISRLGLTLLSLHTNEIADDSLAKTLERGILMQARMSNPATILPDAMKGVQNLYK